MKRALAAVMLVAASLLFAPAAHADKSKDDIFWATVHDVFGINISRSEALTEGAAVCLWLESTGKPFAYAGLQLMQMHPDWSAADAGHFAGAATASWCPDQGPS